MKLILCDSCHDVVRLFEEERKCKCGKSGGKYIDNVNAVIWGNCAPIGFDNHSVAKVINKLKYRAPESISRDDLSIEAFFILEPRCDTIERIDHE